MQVQQRGRATSAPIRRRVGIYARISGDDQGRALGVARQEQDGRDVSRLRNWEVACVYVDNDRSAYTGRRPEFEQMLADLDAGRIDGIVAYNLDRFARQPTDLERAIVIYDQDPGRVFATVEGDINLSSGDGRTMARVMVAFANKSSMDSSRRSTRRHIDLANEGLPSGGGSRPFGYNAGGMTICEWEAALLREAAERVLLGESVTAVCKEWNTRGLVLPGGAPWAYMRLRRMLVSARLAGKRVHKGVVVADAMWPPILDEVTHKRLKAVLAPRPSRPASPRVAFLSGIIYCPCGGKLITHHAHGKRQYVCASPERNSMAFHSCGRLAICAEPVEEDVRDTVLGLLLNPDTRQRLMGAAPNEDDGRDIAAEVRELEAAQGPSERPLPGRSDQPSGPR